MGRLCCVPKCNSSKKGQPIFAMRALPINNFKIFKIWVERIASPKLEYSEDLDYLDKIYRRLRICDRHFDVFCRLEGEKKTNERCFAHFTSSNARNSLYRNWKEIITETVVSEKEDISLPGPSNAAFVETQVKETNILPVLHRPETPKRLYRSVLKSVNVKRKTELTPKALKIYKHFTNLQKLRRRLEMKCNTNRGKMESLRENLENNVFNGLNAISMNFFHTQLKQQKNVREADDLVLLIKYLP
ncbi:hypothetical protein ABEB36_009595 [Hypothenemus hampei]|uniref:THAP-type domain-containing protein n=1 Tax=Hypothenemus hampei TaxID=57062 RepID=A0ABD1EJT7_HYPHA